MSRDCSSLVSRADINDTKYGANATYEIELVDSYVHAMDDQFWDLWSFDFGMILVVIIAIIISVYIARIYYPKYDKAQKKIKLKALNLESTLREECRPLLLPYINQHSGISELIMDYANIVIIEKDLNSIMSSSINDDKIDTKLLRCRCICYILISSFCILPYIFCYHIIAHIDDAYKSYVETNCYVIGGTYTCDRYSSDRTCSGYIAGYVVDMTPICDPDTIDFNKYYFTATYLPASQNKTGAQETCYVNKYDFRMRLANIDAGCPCQNESCSRCGRCSCVAYTYLCIGMLLTSGCILAGCYMCRRKDLLKNYSIQVKDQSKWRDGIQPVLFDQDIEEDTEEIELVVNMPSEDLVDYINSVVNNEENVSQQHQQSETNEEPIQDDQCILM